MEALPLHECFCQPYRMSVSGLPVGGQPSGDASQYVVGKVWYADPWQNQKAAVVGQERQAARAGGIVPAYPTVAGFRFPGGGAEKNASQISSLAIPRQIPLRSGF